jgi:hypothetical protein
MEKGDLVKIDCERSQINQMVGEYCGKSLGGLYNKVKYNGKMHLFNDGELTIVKAKV